MWGMVMSRGGIGMVWFMGMDGYVILVCVRWEREREIWMWDEIFVIVYVDLMSGCWSVWVIDVVV